MRLYKLLKILHYEEDISVGYLGVMKVRDLFKHKVYRHIKFCKVYTVAAGIVVEGKKPYLNVVLTHRGNYKTILQD